MPAHREAALRLTAITKRFGSLTAVDRVSLSLDRGEVVALLGENGAGKTTLMNILFGAHVPDEGEIEAFGRRLAPGDSRAARAAGIAMVHQHFTLADNLTVLENIAVGTQPLVAPFFDRGRALARIAEMDADFGLAVDPGARVGDLSVGERQRVEILKALFRSARVLILDEPTAVLTPQEAESFFATLRKLVDRGLAIIFISHKLPEVMAISDRVIVLRGGRRVGEVRTRETDRHALAAMMVGAEGPRPDVGPAPSNRPSGNASGPGSLSGALRLELAGVTAGPLDRIDLALRAGEITGIAGVAGNGQAALADLLSGMMSPLSGSLQINGRAVRRWSPNAAVAAGIARIPEDRQGTGLIGDMTIAENLVAETYRSPRFSRRGWLRREAARAFAKTVIRDYDVKCPGPDTRARLLSGGNMQKLILGRAFDGDPAVILAAQPSRGLDVAAVAFVHRQLLAARTRGAAILLISEDLDEILALSDRVQVMLRGRLSPPAPRGALTRREIGELMGGAAHAA